MRRGEEGMTLVEVLVAATILVVGVATAVTALNGSRGLTLKSERVDQAVAIGQREIERMRALPFESIGTTTVPTATSQQPGLLGLLVVAEGVVGLKVDVPQTRALKFVPATSTGLPLTSCIAPASVANSTDCPTAGRVSSGNTRGTIYRYVTYQASCLNLTVLSACAALGSQKDFAKAKRITIVVQLDPVNGQTSAPVQTDTVVGLPS